MRGRLPTCAELAPRLGPPMNDRPVAYFPDSTKIARCLLAACTFYASVHSKAPAQAAVLQAEGSTRPAVFFVRPVPTQQPLRPDHRVNQRHGGHARAACLHDGRGTALRQHVRWRRRVPRCACSFLPCCKRAATGALLLVQAPSPERAWRGVHRAVVTARAAGAAAGAVKAHTATGDRARCSWLCLLRFLAHKDVAHTAELTPGCATAVPPRPGATCVDGGCTSGDW